jgi:hypothetical protein
MLLLAFASSYKIDFRLRAIQIADADLDKTSPMEASVSLGPVFLFRNQKLLRS